MYKKIFFAIAFSVIATFAVQAQTPTAVDFQLWNDTQFIIPLNKKKDWSAVVWTFGRIGNNSTQVTDARIGLFLSKKLNKYATVTAGALYRYGNPTFVRKRYETRYLAIATFTAPLSKDKKWTLVNRNMYHYEDRYSRANAQVLRSRFWLKREVTIGKTKIEPFVSVEVFYDSQIGHVHRFREQAGFTRKFNAKFSGDFYYVRQDETNRVRPGTLNGLGTSFRVNF